MALPASFARDGFEAAINRPGRTKIKLPNGMILKPVLIGTEGEQNTGKTEFLFSCPGPGIILCYDRNHEGCMDNPDPPKARHIEDFALVNVQPPLPGTLGDQAGYITHFTASRKQFYLALDNPDAVSVLADGDSDFYELQTLATFGKTTGIYPQTRYGELYGPKRAMIARAWGSGKIFVSTNKMKEEYEAARDKLGNTIIDPATGEAKRVKTGRLERQGFRDHKYLYTLQIRHLRRVGGIIEAGPLKGKKKPDEFGLVILECKVSTKFQGTELWGDKCNFRGLMEMVYPNIDPRQFGLK